MVLAMTLRRQAIVTLLALFSLATAAPVSLNDLGSRCTRQGDYCEGTRYNATLLNQYICGDKRLGPFTLPRILPLGYLVDIYDRFDGACPGEFLEKWFDPQTNDWRWPPANGFSLDEGGQQIKGNLILTPGTLIDRFGRETGAFTSPAGAPYMQRAMPPDRLNEGSDPSNLYNYHVYRVVQNVTVVAGPIAPAFNQPGQGVQYYLGDNINVEMLVNAGSLERVDASILIPVN